MQLAISCILSLAVHAAALYLFAPENSTHIQLSNRIPSIQDLANSQLTTNHGSWWAGFLITGKNFRQYAVISH
ncbi:hypothetical protein N7520_010032 [Penicillium odoratum]|uniref:uncharacterized protein n=1 Tax=Penicillium odoratum TaxID=1167516 RepID=UPI0025471B41|nr:uncharacterized protein N7520_010032 [Penicillium odoratum]KAJ5753115.1 hypothetical protein N7520_010032 [Penicillium odoratum]